MSGGLRMQAGPLKKNLLKNLHAAAATSLQEPDIASSAHEKLLHMNTQYKSIEYAHEKLKCSYNALNEVHENWQAILRTASPEVLEKEEKLYLAMAEDEDGMLSLLIQTREALITLRMLTADAKGACQQLESEVSSLERPNTRALAAPPLTFAAQHAQRTNSPNAPESRATSPMLNVTSPIVQTGTDQIPPRLPQDQALQPQRITDAQNYRLPKMELPVFYGERMKWGDFWSSFSDAVHSQPIPASQKLTYLRSCLRGQSKAYAEGYDLSEQSYEDVVSTLKRQYDNPAVLRRSLHEELQRLPKADQQAQLKALYLRMECILRQLARLNEDTNSPAFEVLIESKLPMWILDELHSTADKEPVWNVDKLRQHLEKIILRKEAIQRTDREPRKESPNPSNYQTPKFRDERPRTNGRDGVFAAAAQRTPPTRPLQFSSNRPQNNNSRWAHNRPQANDTSRNAPKGPHAAPFPCVLCEKTHWASDCTTYRTRDERVARAQSQRRCLSCFRLGHLTSHCRKPARCFMCQEWHPPALCTQTPERNKPPELCAPVDAPPVAQTSTTTLATAAQRTCGENTTEVLLLTRDILLSNAKYGGKPVGTTALFDSGSHRSYITEALAEELNLRPLFNEELSVSVFGSAEPTSTISAYVEFNVCLPNGTHKKIGANTIARLTPPLRTVQLTEADVRALQKEELIPSAAVDCRKSAPGVLIGADYFCDFVTAAKIQMSSGFHVLPSILGPLLCGKGHLADGQRNSSTIASAVISCTAFAPLRESQAITQEVKTFWSLEAIGISDSPTDSDDEIAMQMFQKTVRWTGERYEVGWPWKSAEPKLPSNYGLALGRLQSVAKRLTPQQFQQYQTIFDEQLKTGIIEVVDSAERESSGLVHYLPHQPVFRPGKETTKLRIVFDASARTKASNLSLNDELFRGPVMLPSMVGILLRFRHAPIVLIGDVEKAFHQLLLRTEDRDVTRFLWIRNPQKRAEGNNVLMFRFCRVPFGVISSPFLLAATLQRHLQRTGTPLAAQIQENLYVDNVILHAKTPIEAIDSYRKTKQIFLEGNMNIREFLSNDATVNEEIPPIDRTNALTVKVLGIPWDSQSDELQLKCMAIEPDDTCSTKRSALKIVGKIFDPLGFLGPAVLPLKRFVQGLWKEEKKWDEPLSKETKQLLKDILREWRGQNIRLQRYIPLQRGSVELHAFTDASQYAYAAVIYVRNRLSGTVEVLTAKSRLAPIQKMSIPRLELLGVTIGVRLLKFTEEQLNIPVEKRYLWSDSQCVLHWIASTKEQGRFVDNRLKEIRESQIEFRHVSGTDNPADVGSRGCTPDELCASSCWWHGPRFLKDAPEHWPTWQPKDDDKETTENMLPEYSGQVQAAPALTESSNRYGSQPHLCTLVQENRFSSWDKLRTTVVYVLRFIRNVSRKTYENIGNEHRNEAPTAAEFLRAERILIKQAQAHDETKIDLPLLRPFSDEWGVIRCRGRLDRAELPSTAKQPIYLPRQSRITALIIQHEHIALHHAGTPATLAALRRNYWLPKGRATVKRVLYAMCMMCRRWRAKCFKLPDMPTLPATRVSQTRAFENVGLDFMGPVWVKVRNEKAKRWILLLTCFSTRATHLEIVSDMTTTTFVSAFRRFIARRGRPERILSDNGSQLRMAQEALQRMHEHAAVRGIRWDFTPAHAPWQGGMYERMVGVTKSALRHALGRTVLPDDAMATLVCEVEATVNCRPLTYISDETLDVLRPIDFLIPCARLELVMARDDENDDPDYVPRTDSRDQVLAQWYRSTDALKKFWTYWKKEYLTSLRERSQVQHPHARSTSSRSPHLNEVVLIKDEGLPRNHWKLGRVVSLRLSHDNLIRSITLKTATGFLTQQPINHIYSLELPGPHPTKCNDPNIEPEADSDTEENAALITTEPTQTVPAQQRIIEPAERRTVWPFYLTIILFFATILAHDNAAIFLVAGESLRARCNEHRGQELWRTTVTLYSEVMKIAPASYCRNRTRKICTKAFLRFSLTVTADEIYETAVQPTTCREVNRTMSFKGKSLVRKSQFRWTTNVPTNYEYGWLGTRCTVVTNILLERGSIAVTTDNGVLSNFGTGRVPVKDCEVMTNECATETGTIIWNAEVFERTCGYEKVGTFEAIATAQHVVIEALQAAFTFANEMDENRTDNCAIQNPQLMENHFLISFDEATDEPQMSKWISEHQVEIASRNRKHASQAVRKNRVISKRLEHHLLLAERIGSRPDPANPKYQFVYDRLMEELERQRNEMYVLLCYMSKSPVERANLGRHALKFTAGKVPQIEADQIKITADNAGSWMVEVNDTRSSGLVEDLRKTGEKLIEDVEREVEKSAIAIAHELEVIASHWQGIGIGSLCTILGVIFVISYLRCKRGIGGFTCVCCGRQKGNAVAREENRVVIELESLSQSEVKPCDTDAAALGNHVLPTSDVKDIEKKTMPAAEYQPFLLPRRKNKN